MSYNTLPCGLCTFYDPMAGSNNKNTHRGWCAKKSIYPAHQGPGQVFPAGVQQAQPGQLAKPWLVREKSLVPNCPFAKRVAK